MVDIFDDKTVLITGGTGSFGMKFAEILLKEHNPKSVRIYSRGELKQVEMIRKFGIERLRFFIGDVRDKDRLYRAMNGVDIVVHAAALKHVPICEYNPVEATKTNVLGAINIVDAAIDNGVERVIAISTDKAVQPVNLYGATKLVMEKLIVQGNAYTGGRKTKFSCSRYGNVIGSSGSVVPLFLQQKTSGKVTITDERMTRFWITLEQGVRFIIKCLGIMKGGEIFVPKIPSVNIVDLADVLAPNVKKEIIGVRPGEKLHEVLITQDEARHTREFDDFFVIEPEHLFWDCSHYLDGRPPKDGFVYASNTNEKWLSKDELKIVLKEQGFL